MTARQYAESVGFEAVGKLTKKSGTYQKEDSKMKNFTEMTIEELSTMRAAMVQYFESTKEEYWRRFDAAGDASEKRKVLEDKDAELAIINALIRNIDEAEAEWKKAHTVNFRDKLRQSKSV